MEIKKIAICDDLDIVAEELWKNVVEMVNKHNYNAECKVFLSARELLREIGDYFIVFLDIEMPEIDGIEAGNLIKEKNPRCRIIMATALRNRYKEAFKFRAHRYIEKPFSNDEIEEALISAMEEFPGEECMDLYFNRGKHRIRQRDITMIRAFNGYSEFVVGELVLRSNISLDELEERLDDRIFARVERRYIVNLLYCQKTKNGVKINGELILVSRRNKKEFESRYITFDTRYRGMIKNE